MKRNCVKVSSPTIASLSRIGRDWKRSHQRHYHVPCPHCTEKQVLKWDNVTWPEGKPKGAKYACEHCGSLIEHHQNTAMLDAGEWIPTYPERDVPGFHPNALYSPVGLGLSWTDHAAHWERVKPDPARVKTFTRCWANATKTRTRNSIWRH